MRNIKLIIAYDGTNYFGWQKTPSGSSIEESLAYVLSKILQHPISLQAASRTDAGVHAHGQVVNFFTNKDNLDLDRLHISLNQLLPPDIAVLEVKEMVPEFHPTLDCKQKEYRYFICASPEQLPEFRLYSWHCSRLHFFDEMIKAAAFFVGKQDFSSLCNFRKQLHYESYIREVNAIEVDHLPNNRLVFKIRGQNFLYKMVRNIVGTLAYVGMGKILPNEIPMLLSSQDRTKAGITAPAHGLFLHDVRY